MYKCSNCGYSTAKWMGRCPSCEEWESFYNEQPISNKAKKRSKSTVVLTPLDDLTEFVHNRTKSGLAEFDRVIGGGLTEGSVILVGGEPGIGKSTLLIDIASRFARDSNVLYISAEESLGQVSMRAKRLGISNKNLLFAAENSVESILPLFKQEDVKLIIIDSIQVVGFDEIQAARGSLVQVRESAHALTQQAKKTNTALIIVGHVTKEGNISGPKVLEHIVDSVIYFEGERNSHFRILRAIKNRFGSIGEIGIFEMTQQGLQEVANPSSVFISEQDKDVPGRSIGCVLEGVRPMLIETQSLTSAADFGNPRRRSSGFNNNKLSLILAMMEKRLEMDLSSSDVYLNITGGMRIDDPAADLAAVVAIMSAHQGFVVPADVVFIGEVGLLGELRSTSHIAARLNEIARLGFKCAFVPALNCGKIKQEDFKSLKLVSVNNVCDLQEKINDIM